MSKRPKQNILFRIFQLGAITVVAYILIAGGLDIKTNIKKHQSASTLSTEVATTSFPISATREIEPFTFLNLSAKAAIVYDIKEDKIIFSQEKDTLLPIASITKLMTIYAASKILTPESKITITQEDLNLDENSGLVINESWDFKNLVPFTLISSSNAGANAIAREAQNQAQTNFVSLMNETAKEIGLQNTFFRNPTGLDLESHTISGAQSTVQDVAYLYTYLLNNKPELLDKTNQGSASFTSLDGITHNIANTNQIIHLIPRIISSKTGTTQTAGENLAIIFNPLKDHPVVIVLLGGGNNTRFVDVQKLITDTSRVLNKKN